MSNNASFLPEDYLAQKAELRTNIICLLLFVVVMFGVFLAFMWTNQRWTQVKTQQTRINTEFQAAAADIRMLQELEAQKTEMLHKAELAATLVERVPRSILMAELINRMPNGLSLTEFDLISERIRVARAAEPQQERGATRRAAPRRTPTRAEAAEAAPQRPEAPRFRTSIIMVGVAPTDLEVSRFLAELNAYPLLNDVVLDFSEQQELEGTLMRRFKITMQLDTSADIRAVDPLSIPRRLNNPMRVDGAGAGQGTNQITGIRPDAAERK